MKPYYDDGKNIILHGDTFEILPYLSGVGAVLTDPPYSSGGAFRSDRTQQTSVKYVNSTTQAYRPEFAGDNRDQRGYLAWCTMWLNAARSACLPGAVLAQFTDWRQLPTTTDAVQAAGWTWRGIAVWSKKYGRANPAGFSSAAEFVVWGTYGPAVRSETYPAGVFECQPPRDREHIAQKPEPVMDWLVKVAAPGCVVLDPFMGSGTTLLAAHRAGHPVIGIELEERYCEIAARRLQEEKPEPGLTSPE